MRLQPGPRAQQLVDLAHLGKQVKGLLVDADARASCWWRWPRRASCRPAPDGRASGRPSSPCPAAAARASPSQARAGRGVSDEARSACRPPKWKDPRRLLRGSSRLECRAMPSASRRQTTQPVRQPSAPPYHHAGHLGLEVGVERRRGSPRCSGRAAWRRSGSPDPWSSCRSPRSRRRPSRARRRTSPRRACRRTCRDTSRPCVQAKIEAIGLVEVGRPFWCSR